MIDNYKNCLYICSELKTANYDKKETNSRNK